MKWDELFSRDNMPSPEQISKYIANPLWEEFCKHLESSYCVIPDVQYSVCSAAPGWNVKYRKGSRALCTLYPDDGYFTCLVTIGNREATQAELLLPFLSDVVREIYKNARPINGARWLMLPITTSEALRDAEQLIALRVKKKSS